MGADPLLAEVAVPAAERQRSEDERLALLRGAGKVELSATQ